MMNAILFVATLLMSDPSYRAEDFHYYDGNLQARGLPFINKLYVETPQDKKEFFEFIDKIKGIERFKEFQNAELSGILLFCEDKKLTIDILNRLIEKKYKVSPVVMFDGIECTHAGEILVQVHPSVNIMNFTARLNSVADGKFRIKDFTATRYIVTIDELNNPSNILILANLLAKDTFWTQAALVNWIPLDGYVRANAAVETPAISHLGEWRTFKLTVDVFNPDIVIRTDLLPQLGQSLLPFPFAGEVWFDPFPPEITEVKTTSGKRVTVNFRFRQVQYGNFAFQPIIVSYEKDGELRTVKTNVCQYSIRSVIIGTDIDDIQPRTSDGLDLIILKPVGFPKTENPAKAMYMYIKFGVGFICFSTAAIFLVGALVSLKNTAVGWFTETEENKLWKDLLWCRAVPDRNYYLVVAQYLNKLLVGVYGVSLYSVNRSGCTEVFKELLKELDKLYQPVADYDGSKLRELVRQFCRNRKYQ